jgi:hypothetical protein
MDTTITIAIVSLIGTALGTFGGILTSSKLTNYRIKQLENKVDKHNNLIDRMYKAEEDIALIKKDVNFLKKGVIENEPK